jgi:serpin B
MRALIFSAASLGSIGSLVRIASLASLASLAVGVLGCGSSGAAPTSASPSAPAPVPSAAPAPAPASPVASAPASASPSPRESDVAPATTSDDPAETRAANTFTSKLYARVRRTPGNVMLSGTSVRQPLGLTAIGARGETARELAAALAIPTDPTKAAAAARAEAAAWQEARGKSELIVANRLWSDKAFTVKDDFKNVATSAFGADVEPVDFAHAPDAARSTVNKWVAEKTQNKIPDILAEGAVDKSTRLVLTNAVYFKGRWSSPFPNDATKDEPFRTTATRSVTAPTMHATAQHAYAHVGNAKVLGMRYDGSELGMLIVLPDDVAGLAKLEESLSADVFETWTKAATAQRVAVSLPRFTFKWGGALEATLKDLGVKAAFTPRADLAGIAEPSGTERLQISRVVQKTWVAVDEQGTEAAAASGVTMSVTSAQTGPVAEFKADHPFLFFVYDTKRGRVLFAGRVSDPKL